MQLVQVNKETKAKTVLVDYTTIANHKETKLNEAFKVEYFDEIQGMMTVVVANETEADTMLDGYEIEVNVKYKKRGEAGVPTFMDWDGCVGSVKVLLQR